VAVAVAVVAVAASSKAERERDMDLLLEIVEGPGAGRKIELQGPVVIGRDHSADVVL
jgi:hypothetical protein